MLFFCFDTTGNFFICSFRLIENLPGGRQGTKRSRQTRTLPDCVTQAGLRAFCLANASLCVAGVFNAVCFLKQLFFAILYFF